MLGERHNQARPQEHAVASNEDRTRDLALTKRMLCQLSYRGADPILRIKTQTDIYVKKSKMPPPGIAPGLPAPQAGVLLLYYSGEGMEDPGIDPGSQPCEGCMLPCTTIPHDAFIGTRTRISTLEGLNTTLVL